MRWKEFTLWQVPKIIALLPVLLQLAVVMFLVGLYFFLLNLNPTVTISYSIVSITSFFLYTTSLLLPLIWPSCPFKTPLVPSAIFCLVWCMMTLFILVFIAIAALVILICQWFRNCILASFQVDLYIIFGRYILWLTDRITAAVRVIARFSVRLGQQDDTFWLDREIAHISQFSELWMDTEALAWAPNAIPQHQLNVLRDSIRALPPKRRMKCVVIWTVMHFAHFDDLVTGSSLDLWSPVPLHIILKLDKEFAEVHTEFLLDALPHEWESCDWVIESPYMLFILALLTEIVESVPSSTDVRSTLVPILLKVCQSQQIEKLLNGKGQLSQIHFPAVCLFLAGKQYSFNAQGIPQNALPYEFALTPF